MKVQNMVSSRGGKVANQFIISNSEGTEQFFQSYDSIIIKQIQGQTWLDEKYWDYSNTTRKYRNLFLGEDSRTIKAKIASGEYILTNLN